MAINIRLSGIITDSIVDGPGLRYVIFTQGCPHHCYKCHNQSTWDYHAGYKEKISKIKKEIIANKLIQGITLSGGEPFIQARKCLTLAKFAKKHNLDIVIYSGYTYEELLVKNDKVINKLLASCDYLIDGPFRYDLMDLNLKFRGSSNQRIIDLKATLRNMKIITKEL